MRYRTRLLLTFLVIALAPLLALAVGVQRELDRRLSAQYAARGAALAAVIRAEINAESARTAARLAAIRDALADDNRFRLGVIDAIAGERSYVLDYASRAMRTAGFAMLQIQDENGRIVSSGQFRNEYDQPDRDLVKLLAADSTGTALVDAPTPEGRVQVLARFDSVRLGGRRYTIVGGTGLDSAVLRRLSPDSDFVVSLDTITATDTLSPALAPGYRLVSTIPLMWISSDPGGVGPNPRRARGARLTLQHDEAELALLQRGIDRWFVVVMGLAIVAALAAAWGVAVRVSRPVTALATRARDLDLDRLDVDFSTARSDEIGELSRVLGAMTRRLRSSVARLREAERRAAVGDLARQVTHDVKNGLVPLRHVLRHLAEVEREGATQLATVFAERRPTLEASVGYLESLARTYARLAPPSDTGRCDLNAICREAASAIMPQRPAALRLALDDQVPAITASPLVVRRILDNLIANAIDAVGTGPSTITVATARAADDRVRLVVGDTGRGMSEAELARACQDFYTTKPGGSGLGLSIVRRLTADLGGTLRLESAPDRGTQVTVELPVLNTTVRAAVGRQPS